MKLFLFSIIFIACVMLNGVAVAQQKNKSTGWYYSGLVQGGAMGGSTTITYTAQTVQGVQKNNWFTGIGIGYDDYGIPGIPLILHGQKAFTQKRSKPFVYAQTGVQFPIKKGQWDDKNWYGESVYDLHTGFIGELGAGYLIGLGKTKKRALVFSAGYSYKFNEVTYKQVAWPPYLSSLPPAGYDEYYTELHRYHYRRIAIKAGFKF